MAKTVTVLPASPTITVGATLNGQVRVQNGDAAALRIAKIEVWVEKDGGGVPPQGAVTIVQPPQPITGGGAAGTGTLPGHGPWVVNETSGDVYHPFQLTSHLPAGRGAADLALDIFARVTWSDNSTTTASAANLTVHPAVLP
jgi:hypothetical protein